MTTGPAFYISFVGALTMAVVTGSWLVDILLLVVTLAFLLYWSYKRKVSFFRDQGIPYLKPYIPLVGRLDGFFNSQQDIGLSLYKNFENERFYGFFVASVPSLIVKDPELIQRIMVKDFAHFHDRIFPENEADLQSKNLVNLKGLAWRVLRRKLIPTFSTGKLKQMIDQLSKCGDNLTEEIQKSSGQAIDTRLQIMNFSSEVIGSTAFGLDFGKHNPQTKKFLEMINMFFSSTLRQNLIFIGSFIAPKLVKWLGITPTPKSMSDYFINLTRATKQYRKENNVKRNDYFNLLLTLQEEEESGKNSARVGSVVDSTEEDDLINQMDYVPQTSHDEPDTKVFTDECITAQTFVFLIAGSESVSSTLSFVLYHIAKDPQIQERVKQEVDQALAKHGGLSYQVIKDMTYTDQVIQEAQRFYPILPMLFRVCTIPYAIPDSNFVIPKGSMVFIPVVGLQRDPKYYDSPDVFNPDRFIGNNHRPNPAFMPFGDGPRICIAMRFAILEMKVCIAKIMSKYSLAVNNKTMEPFVFDKSAFFPRPVGGIWLDFKKRQSKLTGINHE